MKRIVIMSLLFAAAGAFSLGCNLFDFTASDENPTSYVEDGNEALRDGDYAAAIEFFDKAIAEDPDNADAHWGRAKAYLRGSGFNTISLMEEVSRFESDVGAELPFFSYSADSANYLYQALFGVNESLGLIYDGVATNDEINKETVRLDYATTLAIHGVISLRDTNRDGVIDENDISFSLVFQLGNDLATTGDWDSIPLADQEALLNSAIELLQTGGEVVGEYIVDLVGEAGLEGIDVENMDQAIDDMVAGLEGLIPGGGGP